jgi:hypothetical protein
MIPLIASIFALGVGPLIYQTFGPLRRTDRIVSGFILVVITATLLFEVLPEAFEVIGYTAIVLAFIGFAGPTIIERLFAKSANQTHMLTIVLGILGLVIHASIDGAALFDSHTSHHHENLSLAIILHRLPVGLTIWWLLKPLIGERMALATIVMMALATAGGYALGMQLIAYHQSTAFVVLQAFISGSLLHVVLHKPHDDGCLHTSRTHELKHTDSHTHAQSHSHFHSGDELGVSIKSQLLAKLPNRWETVGMLLGTATLLALHLSL